MDRILTDFINLSHAFREEADYTIRWQRHLAARAMEEGFTIPQVTNLILLAKYAATRPNRDDKHIAAAMLLIKQGRSLLDAKLRLA